MAVTPPTVRDRYRGTLLGLAAGDALGTTLEFQPPGTFEPIDDMVGGGPFRLPAGAWTDDTSMALCLAESLIECRSFDPVDQLRRYVRWWREGHLSATGACFDIGTTVRKALQRFQRTGEPWCGSTAPDTAGNGSLMRLAPVVLAFASSSDRATRMAGDSSRTTHAAPEAVDACRYFAVLLLCALRGDPKDVIFDGRLARTMDPPLAGGVAEVAAGSFLERQPPAICGTGYVVRSLEAALWAFARGDSFRDGALLAANLGDDADTTSAIFGQLAGAYWGADGIPVEWRDRLVMRETIERYADQLLDLAHAPGGDRS